MIFKTARRPKIYNRLCHVCVNTPSRFVILCFQCFGKTSLVCARRYNSVIHLPSAGTITRTAHLFCSANAIIIRFTKRTYKPTIMRLARCNLIILVYSCISCHYTSCYIYANAYDSQDFNDFLILNTRFSDNYTVKSRTL